MDGNGRWAKQRGKPRSYGHLNGKKPVREAVKAAIRNNVQFLTLYAFSTENWKRPEDEVHFLMQLLNEAISENLEEIVQEGVKIRLIGDLERLPIMLQQRLQKAVDLSKSNDRLTLCIALNYGARQEIVHAVQRMIAQEPLLGKQPLLITSERLEAYLDTAGMPDPDLIIRTSGELRISNFLLWQCAYAEFYFTPTLWPDFTEKELDEAILEYRSRQRRFGALG